MVRPFEISPSRTVNDRDVDAQPQRGRVRRGLSEMVREAGPPFFLGVIAVTIVASAVGLLLKHVVEDSALVRFDIRLADSLEANRTDLLDRLTGIGTFFSDPLPVAVVWLLAVIVTAVTLRNWRPPMLFMIAIGGEKLSYLLTTLVVDRPRPEVETVGKVHVTSSYPSGHVGSAISLWATLALLLMALHFGRVNKRAAMVAIVVGKEWLVGAAVRPGAAVCRALPAHQLGRVGLGVADERVLLSVVVRRAQVVGRRDEPDMATVS